MFSYKFVIDPSRGNSLRLRITNNRRKAEVSLGFSMTQEELDEALSLKPKAKGGKWRSVLMIYTSKIDELKRELLRDGRTREEASVIRDLLKESFFGAVEDDDSPGGGFVGQFEKFIERKRNEGTKGVYKHTLDRVRLFDPDVGKKGFEDIDLKWLRDFEAFCARTASKNARNIHLRNIRAVFNSAIDEELTNAYPFRRFKIRQEATQKRSLSVEELRRVFEYAVEPYQEIYRDMFKLTFLLIGINSVDLHRLKGVVNGRVEFRRAKTGRQYSIKVEPEAQALIDKYRGEEGLLCIADRWSDHRNFRHQCNSALQRIGAVERRGRGGKKILSPEWPELTTYWARHTWATIAYSLDIPKDIIAQALGHGGNDTTEIYIRRDQKKVDEANRKVIDFVLYGKGGVGV